MSSYALNSAWDEFRAKPWQPKGPVIEVDTTKWPKIILRGGAVVSVKESQLASKLEKYRSQAIRVMRNGKVTWRANVTY